MAGAGCCSTTNALVSIGHRWFRDGAQHGAAVPLAACALASGSGRGLLGLCDPGRVGSAWPTC
eukprot:1367556-Rhodomonas_salina.3